MSEFAVEASPEEPHVLRVSGELDIAVVDRFRERAREALRAADRVLEIDVNQVTFIDSTGLGALVRIREEAIAAGKTVRLTHAPRQVSRILDLTGLSDLFVDPAEQ